MEASSTTAPPPDPDLEAERKLYAPPVRDLYRSVLALREEVVARGEATMRLWRGAIRNEAFLPSAENLAQYLALRHRDLSDLQPCLTAYGLSSLGRSEARVLTALDALLATLTRLAGADGRGEFPRPRLISDGELALRQEQDRLLGRGGDDAKTRIMVTLPTEAATDAALARRLLEAGADCARINCAHDGPKAWADMIAHVRAAAAELGRDCRILMDIAGPKCRIEKISVEKARLHRGDSLFLVKTMPAQHEGQIFATIAFPDILDGLEVGAEVWIDDGKLGARVKSNDAGKVKLEVVCARMKGVKLKPEKGINFPDTELLLPPLTDDDAEALDFVAEHADLVGFSFVQRPSDILLLDRELERRRSGRPPQPVVLKIETRLAVQNLPQLIVQGAGYRPLAVMIARGDLAVELGFGRMSEIQEEILWLCDAAHVPVIWATQVLDRFVADGLPTRAETTDAAMSQRAECVMLNKGPFVVEAIGFLQDVLRRMDRHQWKKSARFGQLQSWRDLEIRL